MIVVLNRLTVPETEADALVASFAGAAGRMAEVPGCLGFELWQRQGAGEFQVVTRWRDRRAFEAWRESEAFRRAHAHAAGGTAELSIFEVRL
jgi:heme-degrading monooxygenase HmoA